MLGHVLVKLWLSVIQVTSTLETHTVDTPSTPQSDLSIRTLLSFVVLYTQPCQRLSLSLGMWSTNYSNLHSHFTQSDSCKRMCEKTNHFKPHPVKHGMWINVPCISAHCVLISEGCGFLRSVEESEDMA